MRQLLQATLEEVCEADLLLHVLDASSPSVTHQREAVLQVCRPQQVDKDCETQGNLQCCIAPHQEVDEDCEPMGICNIALYSIRKSTKILNSWKSATLHCTVSHSWLLVCCDHGLPTGDAKAYLESTLPQ